MARKETDDVAEAVAEEAAPDAHIDTSPAKANTGRPNDLPIGGKADANSTLGSRSKAAKKVDREAASNKAVRNADTK